MPRAVRHVWVQTARHHAPPAPGLVVTWQRHGGAWWAWVVTVLDDDAKAAPTVVQHWYHQRDVTPIKGRPVSPDRLRWHQGLYADEVAAAKPPAM